ncbi:MAG: HAD family hydrolase [Candidatus Lokiarchaeota archaeon]|nr:HAD family hydrolase [Candidatus Lokiarchaeota archaeon]
MNNQILLIFDLDFTLIDNSEGIINSFNYSLTSHGHQKLSPTEIIPMIGIPLEKMFSKYVKNDVNIYVKSFREYYSQKGIRELKLLPGTKEKISELKKLNYNLAILTSKKEELARILIKNLQLDEYFNIVLGSTNERKMKNSPLLKTILADKFKNIKKYVVIGDHRSDGEVSEMLKCPFIGLLTGKSTKDDLMTSTPMKKVVLNDIRELNSKIILDLF